MPESLLYVEAIGAAAIVSAMFVFATGGLRGPANTLRLNSACVVGIGIGLAIGCHVLSLRFVWPPMNGLDRFLTIVVPAALSIELFSGFQRVPRWVAWLLRISLAVTVPRILLHGSVFLSRSGGEWTPWQAVSAMAICGALLAGLWGLLCALSHRRPGISIPLALALATVCAGMAVMMAGYIAGGAVAFPLAATLVATAGAAKLIGKRLSVPADFAAPAILGIGVVGLFCVLFIGRFFGRLSTAEALSLALAPLLCWATETPFFRHRKPWVVGTIRLALVAIPLAVVLALAKYDFDRDMAPLLGKARQVDVRRHGKGHAELAMPSNSTPLHARQIAAGDGPAT